MKTWMIAAVLGLSCLFSVSAPAQSPEPTRVCVANTAKIFSDMQELKDLRAKIESERKLLEGVDREKREKLAGLRSTRDALKSDTPQYQERNAELLKAAIEYETWSKINQANFQREQKLQMKNLFEKIAAAVGEVAKQKGFELVLTDQHPEIPDDIDPLNMDQLRALINARNVLYVSPRIDISSDVLAALDAKYRSGAKPQ